MLKSGNYYEYTGCIHIHTTDSDGTKTLEEVADIASSLGLDFIFVSDHMTLKNRTDGKEGYFGNTLVLIGYEHNDIEDCNHYLIFGSDRVLPKDLKPVDYVALARQEGALGIIAHPDEVRPRLGKYPSYPWLAWEAEGFDAVEIWNQMSEWMENLKPYNKVKMVFSPRRFMRSPTGRILQKWDELNKTRKIAGLGAIDVHGFPYKIGPIRITIFPYKVQFKSLRTHLLLSEPLSKQVGVASQQVYDAIRDCRAFVSNYRWGDAAGFVFEANGLVEKPRRSASGVPHVGTEKADKFVSGFSPPASDRNPTYKKSTENPPKDTLSSSPNQEDNTVISGGRLASYQDSILIVKTPEIGTIRIVLNSHIILEEKSDSVEFRPRKNGIYRAEVYKGDRGWIFSNHIRIGC